MSQRLGYEELLVNRPRFVECTRFRCLTTRVTRARFRGRGLRRSPSAIGLRYVVGDKRILSKLALFGYRVDSLEERLVGPPTGV